MDPRVLFVHPYNHLMPQVIPVGAIGAVNLLQKKARGRYAHEVTQDDLENARVILLDLHWFFPLPAIAPMVAEYRRVAPGAKIVAGGLTASFYHELIFGRVDFDYVLIGDVEVSFRTLIDLLLDNELPPPLPNVCSRANPRPRRQRASSRLFNELDWVTIDWFPSYQREARLLHDARDAKHRDWGHAYPLLPLRRGCARQCEFCYGAFQDKVFGEQVLYRSPERLVEDLSYIQASGLSFVTLFFGDAPSVERYVTGLAGRRFSLDAFVFLCGVPDLTVLQGLRDAFDGRVVYSIVQPKDLRRLPATARGADQSRALSDLLDRVQSDPRAGAIVWHMSEPEPSAVNAHQRCTRVFTSSGVDWNATRPNAQKLVGEHSLGTQLTEVEQAARRASAALLLRGLIPALSVLPVLSFGEDDTFNPLNEGELDEVQVELIRQCISNMLERGFYGVDGVRLEWRAGSGEAESGARWSRCGAPIEGTCDWRFGPFGLEWSGELEVREGEACALAVAPTIVGARDEQVELWRWRRAMVPTVPIEGGPRRCVQAGGRLLGDRVEVWVSDGGRYRSWMLPAGDVKVENGPAARGGVVSADWLEELPPWPSPSWPAIVVQVLKTLLGRMKMPFSSEKAGRGYLQVSVGGSDDRIGFIVFQRQSGTKYRTAGRLSFAYEAARGGQADPRIEIVQKCLRKADQEIERFTKGL